MQGLCEWHINDLLEVDLDQDPEGMLLRPLSEAVIPDTPYPPLGSHHSEKINASNTNRITFTVEKLLLDVIIVNKVHYLNMYLRTNNSNLILIPKLILTKTDYVKFQIIFSRFFNNSSELFDKSHRSNETATRHMHVCDLNSSALY